MPAVRAKIKCGAFLGSQKREAKGVPSGPCVGGGSSGDWFAKFPFGTILFSPMTQSQDLNWKDDFRRVYDLAVAKYQAGKRGADALFSDEQKKVLDIIGYTAQEMYDFAEDAVKYGEPDFATAVAIAEVRRDYFLQEQNGRRSNKEIASEELPAKSADLDGIGWLPRLIPKAMAKLKGEMNPDLMYGCGGDRQFFATHRIAPADFLRKAWECDGDPGVLLAYVREHSPAVSG